MKIDRGNWHIESIGEHMVLLIHKEYRDERPAARRMLPDAAALQSMSDLEFERAVRAAFFGYAEVKEPKERRGLAKAAAVLVCVAVVLWAGVILWA